MNGTQAPKAWLLDLTRLVSRVGRGPLTGIDRVELAYLQHLLGQSAPLFALLRAAPGYVLLDRGGAEALAQRLTGACPWGAPDLLSRLHLRQSPARRAAMSDLRRLARASAPARWLGWMLRRHLPPRVTWLNTGHANLVPEVFAALATVPGLTRAVMVHDMIPLDHPEHASPGSPERFERAMRLVGAQADLVICNSATTRDRAEVHFARWGRVPPMLVAHLGVTPLPATAAPLPPGPDPARPLFVVLGTIEPRKNHAFLLDLWEGLAASLPAAQMPQLCIIGSRGWCSAAFFARLDAHPLRGLHIHELPGLSDAQLGAVLLRAHALLFPTLAEGFGLPAAEAAALGLPVICNDLPVFQEVLGNYPIYASVNDRYLWKQEILRLSNRAGGEAVNRKTPARLATWAEHFNTVLNRA